MISPKTRKSGPKKIKFVTNFSLLFTHLTMLAVLNTELTDFFLRYLRLYSTRSTMITIKKNIRGGNQRYLKKKSEVYKVPYNLIFFPTPIFFKADFLPQNFRPQLSTPSQHYFNPFFTLSSDSCHFAPYMYFYTF